MDCTSVGWVAVRAEYIFGAIFAKIGRRIFPSAVAATEAMSDLLKNALSTV